MDMFAGPSLYRSLSTSEFRLLELQPGAIDDPIVCRLVYVPLDKPPQYVALSYVWGDSEDTTPIEVDGQPYPVTTNLESALRHLRKCFITGGVFYWIDAICINQRDLEERADQVTLMGRIFSSAARVIAWLGVAEDAEMHKVVERIFRCMNMRLDAFRESSQGDTEFWNELSGQMYATANQSPIIHAFIQDVRDNFRRVFEDIQLILRRSWFLRIWTVQEAVLAQGTMLFMLGEHITSDAAIIHQLELISKFGGDPFVSENIQNMLRYLQFWNERLHRYRRPSAPPPADNEAKLITFARELNKYLKWTGSGRVATVPHDMIYALFGLIDCIPELQDHLRPRYTTHFSRVYHNYTVFLIEKTNDLNILSSVRSGLEGVPSWVPDLRYLDVAVDEPLTQANVSFSSDGSKMILEGVELGVCAHVWEPSGRKPANMQEAEALHAWLDDFEASFLKGALDFCKQDSLQTLITAYLETCFNDYNALDISTARRIWDSVVGRTPQDHAGETPGADDTADFSNWIFKCISFPHFVTADGVIGRLAREDAVAAAEDTLCIFKGSTTPRLLRGVGEEHILMGKCALLPSVGHIPDAYDGQFFSGRQTTLYTLI